MTNFSSQDLETIRDSELFDADWYLGQYPDVTLLSIDPAEHYLWLGSRLGRDPSLRFDANAYLRNNPDVAAAGVNPLLHYILYGQREGRDLVALTRLGPESDHRQQPVRRSPGQSGTSTSKRPPWRDSGPINAPVSNESPLIKRPEQQNLLAGLDLPAETLAYAKSLVADSMPAISVIVPTWNRAKVVCSAIDSALAQSYRPLEIIISDDGSTDDTLAVIRNSYADALGSGLIRIVENAHRGVSAARNAGMNAAKGELFAYVDSDNVWTPHFLLLMAAVFVEQDELMTAYAGLHSLDRESGREIVRASPFDRNKIINWNSVDLNVFVHRRELYTQFGGFDESLTRLVDWDLILRYTRNYPPAYLPFIGVRYYLDKVALANITHTEPLDENRGKVLSRYFTERLQCGLEALRLAYFVYDFPALSQSFVISELRWLVANGFDVKVYYAVDPDAKAELDFKVDAVKVRDAEELATRLMRDRRTLCHSHFAYPGVTLFAWPACEAAGIPFTFMPHAVDIFHHSNRKRNKVAEIAASPCCAKIFVHGDFHRRFLVEQGVPNHKIAYTLQAVDLKAFSRVDPGERRQADSKRKRGIFVGRFVEKKGLAYLIAAAKAVQDLDVDFEIYGYGPLDDELRRSVATLGLRNVHFRGVVVDRDHVAEIYKQADFCLVPSVEAENGDLDGFPTVILEAMAAEVPVIATTVAAIPDYVRDGIEAILVPPSDAAELERAIRDLVAMSAERRRAMVERAQALIGRTVGVERTMGRLLDTWYGYSIDVILVTHNTKQYDDRAATFEIIRRVLDHTTTAFTLTIIDNASDKDFWAEVVETVADRPNVRLIRKRDNLLCGPASNIGLAAGRSAYAVYLCSKEAFIKEHGWERPLIDYMRANPGVAIAGHKTHLPKYTYGSELMQHPEFGNFRNPGFAACNPDRPFKHVQGGIFIARRDALLSVGGFSDKTPHSNMDVELSYFLESIGYETGEIPCVASITTKTLPRLPSILDEGTVAAHPLTLQEVGARLDRLRGSANHCNICGWSGPAYSTAPSGSACPDCGSTPFGRKMFRVLANDHRAFRGAPCAVLSGDAALTSAIGERMFRIAVQATTAAEFAGALQGMSPLPACIVIDGALVGDAEWPAVWAAVEQRLGPDGELLMSAAGWNGAVPGFARQSPHWTVEWIDLSSQTVGYDWRRYLRVVKLPWKTKLPPEPTAEIGGHAFAPNLRVAEYQLAVD